MPDDEFLEKRIAALEQKMAEVDEALKSYLLTFLDHGAFILALVRHLQGAGLLTKDQMREAVIRAQGESSKRAAQQGDLFLSLLQESDDERGKPQ